MSDFKVKMHQISFPLGLRPRPARGAYSTPLDLLAVFKGPTFKGKEREGGGMEGKTVEKEKEKEVMGRGTGGEGKGFT